MAKTIHTVDPAVIAALQQDAAKARGDPRGDLRDDVPHLDQSPDDYLICVPPGGIGARDGNTLSSALCNVIRETHDDKTSRSLEKVLDGNGDPLQVRVWNIEGEDITCGLHRSARLKSGVRFALELPQVTTTTSTTTTTANTNGCDGECKYIWSAHYNAWSLDSDTCATTTTTTSTTTTTGGETTTTTTSTTTTTAACDCSDGTTTSTTTSTTTTTQACQCLQPTHCGDNDGECVYTSCGQAQSYPPDCTTTSTTTTTDGTTTTTTSTTTTTCDCNTTTTGGLTTTTTGAPGCDSPCTWVGDVINGSWQWVRTGGGCGPSCPCDGPDGNPYCNEASTECQTTSTTTTTTTAICAGRCVFFWIPARSHWRLYSHGCSEQPYCCDCDPPSYDGDECGAVYVPCSCPTTTTAAPTTTTGAPDPCAHCYTTTTTGPLTTTTTTSTTTTTGACDGECKWSWSTAAGAWGKDSDTCAASCPCPQPAHTGHADCEVAWTACVGVSTTTTTTTTTTTSTTTTTCGGTCLWECYDHGGGSYAWEVESADCEGDVSCQCVMPTAQCDPGSVGFQEVVPCDVT